MLSRIAESLFWLARYIERAEYTARILDVNFHTVLEQSKDKYRLHWYLARQGSMIRLLRLWK